jgi:hypothetical protein
MSTFPHISLRFGKAIYIYIYIYIERERERERGELMKMKEGRKVDSLDESFNQ